MLIEYCYPDRPLIEWSRPAPESWREEQRTQKQAERSLAEAVIAARPAVKARTTTSERSLEERLLEHAEKWERETMYVSSPTQSMEHPSYQAILGLARDNKQEVIRFLIQDMREHDRPWFWALSYLTGENPINRADAGKLDKMIASWSMWARKAGLR